MAGLIDDFILLLEQQAEDFSDLAALAAEKKDAIVSNNIEHLQKITDLENTLVGRNQKQERRRMEFLKDIAMVLNVDAKSLTLSRLTDLMKNRPGHDALKAVCIKIRTAADELKRLNEQNKQLIENSLEYVDFSMNLMRGAVKKPSYYNASGEELSDGNTFFDAKQ